MLPTRPPVLAEASAVPWQADLVARLGRIEAALRRLSERQTVKDFYTVAEFAQLVGRAEYTVREWARTGRLHADKTLGGRGRKAEWRFAHAELLRYQAEGLQPEGIDAADAHN